MKPSDEELVFVGAMSEAIDALKRYEREVVILREKISLGLAFPPEGLKGSQIVQDLYDRVHKDLPEAPSRNIPEPTRN